jgi:L-threonylcarbamoyladenylate synthase
VCLIPGPDDARGLVAAWPPAAERLARAFWPGPLTLVLPASPGAPDAVQDAGRIALRPAADPVSAALLAAWRGALFSTSANRQGQPPALDVAVALATLSAIPGGEAIEVALLPSDEGERTAAGRPSTIVEIDGHARILREGAVSAAAIREVVGDPGTSR